VLPCIVAAIAPTAALTVVAVGAAVAVVTVDAGPAACLCVADVAGTDAVLALCGEEEPQPTSAMPMAPGVSRFTSSAAPRLTVSH
jgi:hypothetical protein